MPNYRRAFVPGGCWFFTVNLLDRRQTLLVDQIEFLREAVADTRRNRAFTIDAFVVLPDHLHAVWSLPPGDSDFSTRGRLIKNRFARALPKQEPQGAWRSLTLARIIVEKWPSPIDRIYEMTSRLKVTLRFPHSCRQAFKRAVHVVQCDLLFWGIKHSFYLFYYFELLCF